MRSQAATQAMIKTLDVGKQAPCHSAGRRQQHFMVVSSGGELKELGLEMGSKWVDRSQQKVEDWILPLGRTKQAKGWKEEGLWQFSLYLTFPIDKHKENGIG